MGMPAPQRVIDYAIEQGAHETCVLMGPDFSCKPCHQTIMDAFDHFYGDVSANELRSQIAIDLLAEGGTFYGTY